MPPPSDRYREIARLFRDALPEDRRTFTRVTQEDLTTAETALSCRFPDSYAWFRGLVQNGRKLSPSELDVVADGRVFTGRQALPLKLVDALGGEETAMAWLRAQGRIERDLPVRDWRPSRTGTGMSLWTSAAALADLAGMADMATALRRAGIGENAMRLDGLLAVWHPSLEK